MSPFLETVAPEECGLCPRRWSAVLNHLDRLAGEGTVPALSLFFQREGRTTGIHSVGSRRLGSSVPLDADTLFLTASLTKPIVAMGVLLLVERGRLALNERVSDLLPEFRGGERRPITVRHLLTHTSGLPDMLPDNEQLRREHAPLSRFVSETCRTPLLFTPGKTAQYQSMGYALLGPIVEMAAEVNYPEYFRRELFEPLGMHRTWLGLPAGVDAGSIAEIRVPPEQADGGDWNWNSDYWRRLGAPWGGVLSTAEDLGKFCRATLTGRTPSGERLFSPAILREATTNRLPDFPSLPAVECRSRGWGCGWRMNWKDHRNSFGELLDGDVFGHWGATGTLMWIDGRREASLVLLSTEPVGSRLSPLVSISNMVAAAML